MKTLLTLATFAYTLLTTARALEPGFEPLLDSAHAGDWVHVGAGNMQLSQGGGHTCLAKS